MRAPGLLRALSLWNPHAGFMATGDKQVETRGKKFGILGPLAIASTISIPAEHRGPIAAEMAQNPWRAMLAAHGWTTLESMPRGNILALVWVTAETKMTDATFLSIRETYGDKELGLGYYAAGRVAIHTDASRLIRLPTPVYAKGSQGLWTVPILTAGAILEQIREHPNFPHYRAAFGPLVD